VLAIVAAGIKSRSETYDEYGDLLDKDVSICKRVRHARLKSGNINYWLEVLKKETPSNFTLTVLFSWCTPKTIIELSDLINKSVEAIPEIDFLKIANAVKRLSNINGLTGLQQAQIKNKVSLFSPRTKYLLAMRFPAMNRMEFIYSFISDSESLGANIAQFKLYHLINNYLTKTDSIELLQEIKALYEKIRHQDDLHFYHINYRNIEGKEIPFNIAKSIMNECNNYPRLVVALAEKSCRIQINKTLTPVGQIAETQHWFT
jgi:hypothetical protein